MIELLPAGCRKTSRHFIMVTGAVFLVMLGVFLGWKRPVREEMLIARKEAEHHSVKPDLLTPVWLRKGWMLGTMMAGAVFFLSPWMGLGRREGMNFRRAPVVKPLSGLEAAGCAALMIFAAWQNYPRLEHSLWGDEEYDISVFVLDEMSPKPDATLTVQQIPWSKTLWDMRKPTNHVGYSVLARLAHDAFFHGGEGPRAPWFSEALLRAPVFVAGLLLIPAMFWALRVWGLRPWWALALLVLHPWFERFGSEARGYALMMLGTTLLLGVLGRALQTGRWMWWLAFGLGQFLTLWCCLQGIYPVAGLNLLALGCLAEHGLGRDARRLLLARWLCAGAMGAMLLVVSMAPCWPQLQRFMKTGEMTGSLDPTWWRNSFSMLFFGQNWDSWGAADHPFRHAVTLLQAGHPVLSSVACVVILIWMTAGLMALALQRAWRPLFFFSVGAVFIMVGHMALAGRYPYEWYLCAFLPGLVVMAAAGSELAAKLPRAAGVVVMAAAILAFAWVTQRPRQLLRAHPSEASRESVAIVREVTNPYHIEYGREVISVGFPTSMGCYDPALIRVGDADEIRLLMAAADQSGRKLFVNVNRMDDWRGAQPALAALLLDTAVFEHVAHFPGLMSYTSRDVFRLRAHERRE